MFDTERLKKISVEAQEETAKSAQKEKERQEEERKLWDIGNPSLAAKYGPMFAKKLMEVLEREAERAAKEGKNSCSVSVAAFGGHDAPYRPCRENNPPLHWEIRNSRSVFDWSTHVIIFMNNLLSEIEKSLPVQKGLKLSYEDKNASGYVDAYSGYIYEEPYNPRSSGYKRWANWTVYFVTLTFDWSA